MIRYKIRNSDKWEEIDLTKKDVFDKFVAGLKNQGIDNCEIDSSLKEHENDNEILSILEEIIKKSQTYKEELNKLVSKISNDIK